MSPPSTTQVRHERGDRRRNAGLARQCGSDTFLAALETKTRRRLHALKRGPKPKDDGATAAAKSTCTVTVTPASPTSWKPTRTKGRQRVSRKGESVGRPVGLDAFLAALETRTRRRLHALKPGPKSKDDGATATAK